MNDFIIDIIMPALVASVLLALLLGMVYFFVVLIVPLPSPDTTYATIFTNWTNLCREQGGVIQPTSPNNFECFKDGKIILHLN